MLPALGSVMGTDVPQHLQGVGGTLAGFGKDIVEGTKEVGEFLKQVGCSQSLDFGYPSFEKLYPC